VLAGSFMAVLDTTIVNVALPSIGRGAHASSGALEWVVSGYALTFGLALVPAGRKGDRFGYKRLFPSELTLQARLRVRPWIVRIRLGSGPLAGPRARGRRSL
jgi:MFS family permease